MLATLQGELGLGLALDAFQSQNDLLGRLGLLVEDRLGLTTITGLLTVVSALSLGEQRGLASLVLGDLVLGVLAALLALAVGVSRLGNVDLNCTISVSQVSIILGLWRDSSRVVRAGSIIRFNNAMRQHTAPIEKFSSTYCNVKKGSHVAHMVGPSYSS